MREAASVVVESIAREKIRHVSNAVATGTAATVGTTGSMLGEVLGWLPHVAVLMGLIVSCALFYKTHLEIKLARIALAKEISRVASKKGADS